MKIVIAPDSFKGSLSAQEVAWAIERGIKRVDDGIETLTVPMADGGEGTVDSLVNATGGQLITAQVNNPLRQSINSSFGILGNKTAVIEIAAASGLALLKTADRNPMLATSYGTGELIKQALDHGCHRIIVGLGGSATNEGGSGILKALGVKLLDLNGNDIGFGGQSLSKLHSIDISQLDPRIHQCEIIAACDVNNPLCGENGASAVYGPQKGADQKMVGILDHYLLAYGRLLEQAFKLDIVDYPGAGAAGGIGAALLCLGAKLKRGIDIVIETTRLEEKIQKADLVITGEGSIDFQTAFGKTPFGVATLTKKYNLPVVAIAGGIGRNARVLYDKGFDSIFSICDHPMTLDESMQNCAALLEDTAERIIRAMRIWAVK